MEIKWHRDRLKQLALAARGRTPRQGFSPFAERHGREHGVCAIATRVQPERAMRAQQKLIAILVFLAFGVICEPRLSKAAAPARALSEKDLQFIERAYRFG